MARDYFPEEPVTGTPAGGKLIAVVGTPADGDVVTWVDANSQYEPAAPGGAGSIDLDDLADVDTTGVSDGDVLTFDSGSGEWVPEAPSGGSGEANTASNVGGEAEVFKQKTGVDLEFRTLEAGAGVTITQNTDTVAIAANGVASLSYDIVSPFTRSDPGHACSDRFDALSLNARWSLSHNTPTYNFDDNGSIRLSSAAGDSKIALGQPYTSLAVNPPTGSDILQIEVALHARFTNANNQAGIYISDGTKLFGCYCSGAGILAVTSYSGFGSGTFAGSNVSISSSFVTTDVIVFRVTDDGTNITVSSGVAGFCFKTPTSFVRSYLTPSEFGIYVNGVSAAFDASFHWFRVTQP